MSLESSFHDSLTRWSIIFAGHPAPGTEVRNQLLLRYHCFIYRMLHAWLRDDYAVSELFSDFAVCVVTWDPCGDHDAPHGLRGYLHDMLWEMVQEYQERRCRQYGRPVPLRRELTQQEQAEFLAAWRDELIGQVWQILEREERQDGQPYAAVLRSVPRDREIIVSKNLARRLSDRLGQPVNVEAVAGLIEASRDHYAQLLLDEVERSQHYGNRTGRQALESELDAIGLFNAHTKKALENREQNAKGSAA